MWIKAFLIFFAFSFLLRSDQSFDQDLGRHIKLGEIIFQTHQVPKVNLFSYTNPDFPFINTHWLFEVLVFTVNQTIGLEWMLIFKIVIILLSVWLVFKTIPKEKQVLLLPVGFIFLHVLRERTDLRPEIFSFLFTALTLYILEKFIENGEKHHGRNIFVQAKPIFFLPLIQLTWINTHIYFFIGFALQVIFIVHLIYHDLRSHFLSGKLKLLAGMFILSVILSPINPNGVKGLSFPLNVNNNYGYTIVENQTMFLLESINFKDPNFLWVKISGGIILLSVIVVILNVVKNLKIKSKDTSLIAQDGRLKNILLSLSGLLLALMHVRSFPYLVFLSLPATVQNFGHIPWNTLTRILTITAAVLLILESYFYLNGDYYRFNNQPTKVGLEFKESGKNALNFMISKNLPQPLFNNFDIGSYIIYRGHPKYQVFVDGRPEAYPAQFFTGVYIPSQSDYKNFKEIEKIYGFKTIIFSHTDQTPWGRNFLQNVIKDPEWRIVYIDDFTIVLVSLARSDLASVEVINLAQLNPNFYKFDNHVAYLRLGIFLLSTGHTDSGRQFISKALQVFPDSPILTGKKNDFFW